MKINWNNFRVERGVVRSNIGEYFSTKEGMKVLNDLAKLNRNYAHCPREFGVLPTKQVRTGSTPVVGANL